MPAFGPDRLSDSDLDDLVRYLQTLRGFDPDGQAIGDADARPMTRPSRTPSCSLFVVRAAPSRCRPAGAAAAARHARRRSSQGLPAGRLALADVRRQLRATSGTARSRRSRPTTSTASCRSGRSRPARSAISKRRRSCATTCCTSPARRTSRGRIDARTGRQIWRYRRELPPNLTACCGLVNRGFGVLGDKLFMTTLDAHLLALDMKTGAIVVGRDAARTTRSATPRRLRRSSSRTR